MRGGSDLTPLTKVQDFGPKMVQNLIFSKYELNKSCWKLNVEWKKCKIDLSRFKIGDLVGGQI